MTDIDWKRINPLHDEIFDKLNSLTGKVWKELNGELHSKYLEMPFWILVYDDMDIKEVHDAFLNIVKQYIPKIEPVQMTVSYTIYTEDEEIQIDFLNNNKEIIACGGFGELGSGHVVNKKEEITFFNSKTSSRSGP